MKQKIVFQKRLEMVGTIEAGSPIGKTMLEAGYSKTVAENPKKLTESKGFRELMEENGLDDASLTRTHNELLKSARLDHMIFPLGPKKHETPEDAETLADTDIKLMLADLKCTVRRIVHGETARHVYFWSPNDKTRTSALDMGYKLKGHYAPEKKMTVHAHVNVNPKQQAIADKYAEELKQSLME